MQRLEKTTIGISSLLMGIILSRFAISKLAGWEISVDAFIEMAKPLGIDPTFFRVSTGFLILILFLSYLTVSFLSFFQNKSSVLKKLNFTKLSIFANILGVLIMTGALLSEFFLRLEPKMPLVFIAIGVIILSAINVWILRKKQFNISSITQ